jgi:hypothetical protein
MLDDVEDKIRRNLLVYSWTILVTFWIDRPIWYLVDIFDNVKGSIPAQKLIVIAIVIQIYLLLRYRFSSQALRAWRRYLVEVGGVWRKLVASDIRNKVRRFKFNRANVIFQPNLQAYILDDQDYEPLSQAKKLIMREMEVAAMKFDSTWSGSFSCNRHLSDDTGAYSARSGGNRIDFRYTGLRKAFLVVRSIPTLLFYTKGAVEMIFPFVLGVTALSMLLIRLFFV